jgi:uncharacterized protein YndB with AHSA1/START domain
MGPGSWRSLAGAINLQQSKNRYAFHVVTHLKLKATADELVEIIADMDALSRWWPAAFLRVETVVPGQDGEVGRVVRMHTKGLMPHTFQFLVRIEACDLPHRVVARMHGDFEGENVITLKPGSGGVDVAFDWLVEVRKKGLRPLTPFIRGLLLLNHLYAMRAGARGLKQEIARRRALRSGATTPPLKVQRPSFPHNLSAVRRLYGWRVHAEALS